MNKFERKEIIRLATNIPITLKVGNHADGYFSNTSGVTLEHKEGTLYVSKDGLTKGYIYYDDGQNFINIVPKLLGYVNGGTGVNLTQAPAYSVFIQNATKTAISWVANAKGAFYVSAANTAPIFGTLPASVGGTGLSTLTEKGVLYGNGTDAVGVTAAGTEGQILAGGTPTFVTPSVSWVAGKTAGPKFRLSINGVNYDKAIPSASETASGVITTEAQTLSGIKTFKDGLIVNGNATFHGGFTIDGNIDAYYNSASDQKTGSLNVVGGLTTSLNMRVDGGTIQFSKSGKISFDDEKECFNFIF